jgi:hypothetical protein
MILVSIESPKPLYFLIRFPNQVWHPAGLSSSRNRKAESEGRIGSGKVGRFPGKKNLDPYLAGRLFIKSKIIQPSKRTKQCGVLGSALMGDR